MNNPVKSISTIRNFMGNAGRNTCNDYLYEALQDAVEALEIQIPKKVLNRRELKDFHEKTYSIEGDCPACGHEGLRSSEVTEDLSYNTLKTSRGLPCCKDVYYDLYHKFFYVLNKKRN